MSSGKAGFSTTITSTLVLTLHHCTTASLPSIPRWYTQEHVHDIAYLQVAKLDSALSGSFQTLEEKGVKILRARTLTACVLCGSCERAKTLLVSMNASSCGEQYQLLLAAVGGHWQSRSNNNPFGDRVKRSVGNRQGPGERWYKYLVSYARRPCLSVRLHGGAW